MSRVSVAEAGVWIVSWFSPPGADFDELLDHRREKVGPNPVGSLGQRNLQADGAVPKGPEYRGSAQRLTDRDLHEAAAKILESQPDPGRRDTESPVDLGQERFLCRLGEEKVVDLIAFSRGQLIGKDRTAL